MRRERRGNKAASSHTFRAFVAAILVTKANGIALHMKEDPIARDPIPVEKSIECPEQDEPKTPIFHRNPKYPAAFFGSVEGSFKNYAHRPPEQKHQNARRLMAKIISGA